ncbi:Protein NDRG3 [Gracilariopsis chorda]|uniref:Protein NDRG3 n=1 Tax=Gracilariopsis chorda TaxID=448386 RepID=A0A2V3IWX9_9FLOR|nr:Protein NDRG3 [Gracilariopsis chorda]|eukprot:PXF46609.1 Protein NDRG3 [Gracilariopsis chorda]
MDFDLVVESQPGVQTLEVPPNWTTDTFIVRDVTVEVHIHPRQSTMTTGPPILTFHDVGQNAAIAFGPFFSNFRRTHSHIDAASAHYHLTAPGHMPDEPECGSSVGFGMDDMVKAVLDLLDRVQVPRCVAFGIGLGGAILIQAAATRPKAFAGLVLISPVLHPAPRWDRISTTFEGFFSKNLGMGLTQRMKDRFFLQMAERRYARIELQCVTVAGRGFGSLEHSQFVAVPRNRYVAYRRCRVYQQS